MKIEIKTDRGHNILVIDGGDVGRLANPMPGKTKRERQSQLSAAVLAAVAGREATMEVALKDAGIIA